MGLVKLGDNVLTLTGANNYSSGTQIDGGTLEAQTTGSLPGYNSYGMVIVGDGATLAVAVGGMGEWQSGNVDSVLTNAQFSCGSALGIDTSDGSFVYGSNIADTAGGPLGLVKLGDNTLTLTGGNSYSDGTEIDDGTLTVQNYSLPTGGGIDAAGGATLHYDTTAGSINQLPTTFTGYGTLLVDGGNSLIFGGACGDLNVNFSPGAIIDVEAGTLVGSSDSNGQWADNCASLNVATGATFDGGDGVIYIDALSGDGTFQGGAAGPVTATIGVADGSGTFSGVIQDNGSALALAKMARAAKPSPARTPLRAARTFSTGHWRHKRPAHCPATTVPAWFPWGTVQSWRSRLAEAASGNRPTLTPYCRMLTLPPAQILASTLEAGRFLMRPACPIARMALLDSSFWAAGRLLSVEPAVPTPVER